MPRRLGVGTLQYTVRVGTARNLERRIERMLDGLAGLMFGGELHASEFGIHVLREADLAVEEGPTGPTIPNVYRLTVHTGQEVPAPLGRSLEALIEETAAERGWRLDGPATVTIDHSERVPKTDIACTTETVPGPRTPWAQLVPTQGPPIPITRNRARVGRSSECDVVIEHPEISRVHATVWREGGRAWIQDAGSANGTLVDGTPVTGKPVEIDTGAVVSFGPVTFDFQI
jgi:hypothetical protein